jgi:radical SAM superfamily enzyme YgiQ (UPF0313 family)
MPRFKKIVLLIPNSRWKNSGRTWVYPPIAAAILTSILKDYFNFSIIDAMGQELSEVEASIAIIKLSPDIACVTGASLEEHEQVHRACACVKNAVPGIPVVLGGIYATTLPEVALMDHNIDWCFLYHAEERAVSFFELLLANDLDSLYKIPGIAWRKSDGQVAVNPLKERIGDCKNMVTPDYSQLNLKNYLYQETPNYQSNAYESTGYILTSYGCPYNCVFCASRTISGKKVALRHVDSVSSEIKYLIESYRITQLVILDDAFLTNRQRAIEILSFIRKTNLKFKIASVAAWDLDAEILLLLKNAGCSQLTISVESGCQRVLTEIIHKPLRLEIVPPIVEECHRLGIMIGGNIVIGLPGETWDEIRESIAFAEKCNFDVLHLHIATPLPQTDLYKLCRGEEGANFLPEDFSFTDPSFFGFCKGFIRTDDFTPEELQVLRAYEWDRINFSTHAKRERVRMLYRLTPDELKRHRRQTRLNLGVY